MILYFNYLKQVSFIIIVQSMLKYSLVLNVIILTWALEENFRVDLPPGVLDIQYSRSQQFVGVLFEDSLSIYQGQTMKLLESIKAGEGETFSAFAFSQDDSFMVVGLQLGKANLYKLDLETKLFVKTDKIFQSQLSSFVDDVCFLDNSRVVFAINKGQVNIWDFQTDVRTVKKFENTYVTEVSCSNQNQFVSINGINLEQNVSFLVYNEKEQTIQTIHSVSYLQEHRLYGVTHSPDGILYGVGAEKIVWKYDMTSFEKNNITSPVEIDLTRIQVSTDSSLIAVAAIGRIFAYSADGTLIGSWASEETTDCLALALKEKHLLYISPEGKGVDLGQCPKGFFLDSSDKCTQCESFCNICWSSSTQCFDCKASYFVKDNQCVDCPAGCLDCLDELQCTQCDSQGHFIDDGGLCKCELAFYLKEKECLPCSSHCLSCRDSLNCSQCQEPFSLVGKECACRKGTYQEKEQCLDCQMEGCSDCSSSEICTQCNGNQSWQLNKTSHACQCAEHHYRSENSCLPCTVLFCRFCTGEGICNQCDDRRIFLNGKCQCEGGFFDNNNTCEYCMPGCTSCSDRQSCQTCNASAHFQKIDDSCRCSNGFYAQDRECLSCTSKFHGCEKCTTNECVSCKGNLSLINGSCSCLSHQFIIDNSCQECSENCATCEGNSDKCLSCHEGQRLDNNKCISASTGTIGALVIVIIVIVAVLIVAAAGVFVVKRFKRRRRQSSFKEYHELK